MIKTTLIIDGMMCSMCETHVCETIRKAVPAARKVTASRGRREATFLTEEPADAEALKAAIDTMGYSCAGITSELCEKKGWFGRK